MPAALGTAKGAHWHGGGGVPGRSSDGNEEGVALFTSLLQSLTRSGGHEHRDGDV